MAYVDGFIVPVPKKNLSKYLEMSRRCGKVWMDHGALEYWECAGDDTPKGKVTSFPRSVKLKSNEMVIFSFILYRSRAARDRINGKVMKDPRLAEYMNAKAMPFDGKRMIWGGFKPMIRL
jgi:uncharacterized protein YbaA (DUF1428 family)